MSEAGQVPRRWLRRTFFTAGLLLVVLLAYTGWTAWAIWTFDASSDRNADAAVVLGASTRDGEPSPVFVERIRHGIDLYKSGRVHKLILTGGVMGNDSISLAETAQKYALANGVPARDIILEKYSQTTRENLAFTEELAAGHRLSTFLIVSDPPHLRRAMQVAEDLGLTAWPSATPTSSYASGAGRLQFVGNETHRYIIYVWVIRHSRLRTLAEAERRR